MHNGDGDVHPPASSSPPRPTTAHHHDKRPTTSHAGYVPPPTGYLYDNDDQFAMGQEMIEEDDESEVEDVFAYLPPTTADQLQAAAAQAEPVVVDAHTEDLTHSQQATHPTTQHIPPPSPPPATFDPSRYNPPQTPATPTPPQPSYYVDSPPSTDSQADNDDPYRLRRLSHIHSPPSTPATATATAPAAAARPYTARSPSSEVHVELAASSSGDEKGMATDVETAAESGRIYGKTVQRDALGSGSVSITPSMMDYVGTESREGSIKMGFDLDILDEEDSPYPEVRSSVSNVDDPEMPALTLRMWIIGLILCMASSAMNVFFNFRFPAPTVVPLVLLLVSYPLGKMLAFSLPIRTYRLRIPVPVVYWARREGERSSRRGTTTTVGGNGGLPFSIMHPSSWKRSGNGGVGGKSRPHIRLSTLTYELPLNPGPWNIKEHVLVYIMANVSVGPPYALNALVVSEYFYGIHHGFWFNLVLVLATQLTGFGLAGLCRRFLVWPASMVWPQNLVACTLLNTLHAEEDAEVVGAGVGVEGGNGGEGETQKKGWWPWKWGTRAVSRYRFYVVASVGAFFFYFLPDFLFQALSIFSWITWIAPKNVVVNQLFGVSSGLGMSVLTLDWTEIGYIGSPLMVPWWAEVHVFGGFVLFYWILTPILYYTNVWQLSYFPMSANYPYDRFGKTYNVNRILDSQHRFDAAAYEAYSPLYLPGTYAITYLLAFALSTCVIVHTLLYHGHSLLNGLKKIKVEKDDIHAKLMRNYPEVPDWWYMVFFAVFFSMAIVAAEVWHTDVPVWALLLAVALPIIYILPSGFIYAMTGQGITLNLIAQIIPGTLLPGNPLANMVFKAYSVQTLTEATNFVQDLKLGHYVKVPPRATFLVQSLATILAAFVQVGVKQWMFSNIPDICTQSQKSKLICPHNQVFFTASVIWGLIGPNRQFGKTSIYHPQLYAIIIGALLPIPAWLWQRRHPNSWLKMVSTPVILNGVSFIPPATGINYSSWFFTGFIFQYLIRRRNFGWWSKFNYVTSAALDSGTVLSLIFIFFTLEFPRGGRIELNWWGNNVFTNTSDYLRVPLRQAPPEGLP